MQELRRKGCADIFMEKLVLHSQKGNIWFLAAGSMLEQLLRFIQKTIYVQRYTRMIVRDTRTIVYDDYNSHIPENQSIIGTITTMFGRDSLRHGFKILVIYEQG